MDVHRIGMKFCLDESVPVRPAEFVPVFHRWIQTHAVDGLLIDVADYGHVHHGPGILLVADEGNYSLDLASGRPGLAYWRKRPLAGDLAAGLLSISRILLRACREVELAPEFEGALRFRGAEVLVTANDRLRAPNDEETMAAFSPFLATFARQLYGEGCTLSREQDLDERFAVTVTAPTPISVGDLAARVEA